MIRPAWKSHIRVEVLPPDDVVLLVEDGHHIFSGVAYARLAPLLDGRRTPEEALALAEAEGVPPLAARLALSYFEALGLLDDADPGWCEAERAHWHGLGRNLADVAGRLESTSVAVRPVGGSRSHSEALERALQASRIRLAPQPGAEDLLVVMSDDYLDPRLGEFNRARLGDGRPWALVKLVGAVVWVGPLFLPGRTGCWACLEQRIRLNRQTEHIVRERTGVGRPPQPASPWSIRLAAAFAAAELTLWLGTGRHEGLEGTVAALDLRDNSLTRHPLTRRPQCPECGVGRSAPEPGRHSLRLEPAPKREQADGRGESPESILDRLGRHVSPITGVVRSVNDLAEAGLALASAAQSFPMSRYDFRVLRDNLIGRSGGKGTTPSQARAGALCEALERYSGTWQPENRAQSASRAQLGEEAVDLAGCLGFSPRQYAGRDAWNATNDEPHAWIPRPLDPDQVIDWVPLQSLTHERTRLVPAAYAYYGHPDLRLAFCASDSNGCAAGATPAEAVAQGLLEVIERDAVGIWWFNRLRRPAISLDRPDLPIVRDSLARHCSQGREAWALDLTTDVGIPVIAAVSARVDRPVEDIIFGFGADLDASAALVKAVMEMDQTHFWVSRRNPDGSTCYRTDRPAALRWFRSATRANQPYLVPDPGAPPGCRVAPEARTSDWRDDVDRCVDRLRGLGLEVLILDQSRPDIGLPVFRVVVPGMCHFWSRHGRRRLYEVPVALGWRAHACPEEDLNPWCIYF
jgi:ribosomal protein S12 methylthiotransferase accessory factor